MRVFLFVSWVLSAVSLVAAEWKIEVANTRHQREDFVVHAEVNQEWVRLMGKSQLAERLPNGTLVPIPTVLDQSADVPVLTWRLSGKTPPERCRTFTLLPRKGQTDIDSDLKVIEGKDEIKISNRYFSLSHPVRGKGGFPRQITYASSRLTDGELYFLDRVVCRGAEGGLRQFFASGFEKSFAKVVFRSPLKVVVEVFSGFAGNPQMSQGTPRVVYRYVYCPNTPVVRVSARYERGDDREWSEVHFLHLSRKERGPYQKVTTGSPVVSFPLNAKGTKSLSRTGRSWCVMSDGQNGCGVGGKCPVFWDASSDFVYYLRGGLARWDGPERLRMKGCLYFGTAVKTTDPLPWLDPARQPEISFWKDGKPSLLLDAKPLAGTHYLENGEMRIAFGSAAEGFDCLGILNTTSEPMRFVYPHDQQAGLWRLDFRGPSNAKGARERFAVDNHAKARKRFAERKGETLFFHWEGIDLPREPGALDVTVSIALPKPKGVSRWRISLKNRSARWGLWSTDFPYLSSVVPSGKGDLVAPTGNWGGSLRKRSDAGLTLPDPPS